MLFAQILNLAAALHKFSLLVLRLFLELVDVALLVHSENVVIRRTHVVLEIDAVLKVIREVPFRFELIDPVETIVAPALTDLELALIDTEDHLAWSQVVDELYAVLVHLRLHSLNAVGRLEHLQEDRDVGALGILAVPVGVDFEPPRNAVGKEGRGVDRLLRVAELREMTKAELAARVLRNDVTWEISLDLVWRETVDGARVQVSDLADEVSAPFDQLALGLLIELDVELSLEFFEFDNFLVLGRLDAIECSQLVLCL